MNASTVRKSLVRATEDGERRWFLGGGLHIWKPAADDTDGAFLLFDGITEREREVLTLIGRGMS